MQDYRLKPEHRKGYTPPKDEPPLEDPRDKEVKTHYYTLPSTWGDTSTKRKFTGILALAGAQVQELGTKPSISSDGTPCITTLPEPKPKVDRWEWLYSPEKMQYILRMENGEEYVFTEEYLYRMGPYVRIAVAPPMRWAVFDPHEEFKPLDITYIEIENPIYTRQRYSTYGYSNQTHNDTRYSYDDIYENLKRAQEALRKEEERKRQEERYYKEEPYKFDWGPRVAEMYRRYGMGDDFNDYFKGSGA